MILLAMFGYLFPSKTGLFWIFELVSDYRFLMLRKTIPDEEVATGIDMGDRSSFNDWLELLAI